jgi:hypothetical protein
VTVRAVTGTPRGAASTIACGSFRTANERVTERAAERVAEAPARVVAATVHVPGDTSVTVAPATVQTPAVRLE